MALHSRLTDEVDRGQEALLDSEVDSPFRYEWPASVRNLIAVPLCAKDKGESGSVRRTKGGVSIIGLMVAVNRTRQGGLRQHRHQALHLRRQRLRGLHRERTALQRPQGAVRRFAQGPDQQHRRQGPVHPRPFRAGRPDLPMDRRESWRNGSRSTRSRSTRSTLPACCTISARSASTRPFSARTASSPRKRGPAFGGIPPSGPAFSAGSSRCGTSCPESCTTTNGWTARGIPTVSRARRFP